MFWNGCILHHQRITAVSSPV